MSLDYKKYGYEEMTEANHLNKDHARWSQISLSREPFLWKNKNMNIIDAIRIYDKFNNSRYDINNDFKLDCWSMSHPELPVDMDEKLKIPDLEDFSNPGCSAAQIQITEDYKKKKLSL